MPRRTRWRFGGGTVSKTPRGTFLAYRSVAGRRDRRVFKTLEEASAWLCGGAPPDVGAALALDAREASRLLPDGVSLVDAARFWLAGHAGAEAVPLAEAWARYESAAAVSVAPRTLKDYRSTWRRFASAFPAGATTASVTREALERFVAPMSAVNRNSTLLRIGAVCSVLRRRGLLAVDPVEGIARARNPRPSPAVLAVADAAALMARVAEAHPSVAAYFALGLFAGVRPQELMRVRPAMLRNGYLVLDAAATKTSDARSVPVRENLAAWLARFPVPARGFSDRAVRAAKADAPCPIPPDSMRHSYATYLYELTGDAAAVAATMGHAGTDVFFRHYRALAAPGDGARFFAILPPRS